MRHSALWLALVLWSSSAHTIAQTDEDQQTAARSDFWAEIKRDLSGPEGIKYWEALKEACIPCGLYGVHTLRGTVISSTPADHPNELVLAMSDDPTPEVTLRLFDRQDKPIGLTKPVEAGTVVEFGGAAKDFSREPFMLTIRVWLIVDPNTGLFILDKATKRFQRTLE